MQQSRRSASASVVEIRDNDGRLIGGTTTIPVSGLMVDILTHAMTHVGWAQDWGAENPADEYRPVLIGVNDDRQVLVAEIERRAELAREMRLA